MAVFGILAFHVFELTGKIGVGFWGHAAEVAGFEAVLVFFVISGFLLYRPYVSARARDKPLPSTRRYARRRALRILPAYWTVLTALAIFPGIAGVFTGQWWRYYGYLQLYSEKTQLKGIPVAWSLCVEVTYYLALPLWAIAIRRAGRGGRLLQTELAPLAAVIALGFGVQLGVADRVISHVVGATLLGQCSWIAIGMALAVLSVVEHDRGGAIAVRRVADRPGLCWLGAAAAFGVLMTLQPAHGIFGLIATASAPQSVGVTAAKIAVQTVFLSLLVLPAVFGDFRRGLPRRTLALRPLAWVGVISYSFYLWHLTVAEWIAQPRSRAAFSADGLGLLRHVHGSQSIVLYVIVFAATAVLASISYRLVELPFLRRKERRA